MATGTISAAISDSAPFLSEDFQASFALAYVQNGKFNHWLNDEEIQVACAGHTGKYGLFEQWFVPDPAEVDIWFSKTGEKKDRYDQAMKFQADGPNAFKKGDCMLYNQAGKGHWERVVLEEEGEKFRLVPKKTTGDGMCGAHAAFGEWDEAKQEYHAANAVDTYFAHFTAAHVEAASNADAENLLKLMIEGMLQEVVVGREQQCVCYIGTRVLLLRKGTCKLFFFCKLFS